MTNTQPCHLCESAVWEQKNLCHEVTRAPHLYYPEAPEDISLSQPATVNATSVSYNAIVASVSAGGMALRKLSITLTDLAWSELKDFNEVFQLQLAQKSMTQVSLTLRAQRPKPIARFCLKGCMHSIYYLKKLTVCVCVHPEHSNLREGKVTISKYGQFLQNSAELLNEINFL